ncbi:hypothetical protein [Hymenobacter crusticola]|nr:hypothetical protein [Hymenobacter crusticola]
MDNSTRLAQRIKEFQHLIGVPKYNSVIAALITEVFALPIEEISVDYQSPNPSRHRTTQEATTGKESYRIFIRATGEPGHDRMLLFDILHELGHFHDPVRLPIGQPIDSILQRDRELQAWQWADEKFNQYPELEADWALYKAHQRRCLGTYGIG